MASAETKVSLSKLVTSSTTYAEKAKQDMFKPLLALVPDLVSMLPSTPVESLTAELTAYSSLANAIRRTLLEEIPVDALDVQVENFQTDDRSICFEFIRLQINSCALKQCDDFGESLYADYVFKLHVENKTTEDLAVWSNSIVAEHKGAIVKNWCSYEVPLFVLKPGKVVKIKKMGIIRGTAYMNAAAFTCLNSIHYAILDVDFYDETTKKGVRASMSMPSKFRLGYQTKGNIGVKSPLRKALIILLEKMRKAKTALKKYETNPENSSTEDLEVLIFNDVMKIVLKGEYCSIPQIIAQNAYFLDKSHPYVAEGADNPNSPNGYILVKNLPNSIPLLIRAAEKAIQDLTAIIV